LRISFTSPLAVASRNPFNMPFSSGRQRAKDVYWALFVQPSRPLNVGTSNVETCQRPFRHQAIRHRERAVSRQNILTRIQGTYREFPVKFRVLVIASFIDRVGGTMLFTFFALYVTRRFNVGMTEAGVLLGIFSLAGLAGNMVGGALTDKLGRRPDPGQLQPKLGVVCGGHHLGRGRAGLLRTASGHPDALRGSWRHSGARLILPWGTACDID